MRNNAFTIIELLVVIFIIGTLIGFLLPAISSSRERARCILCTEHMEQIGAALLQYHKEHEAFPPAYSVDEDGKPLHGWPVLILPYLPADERVKTLIDEIRLDEDWCSEHNSNFYATQPQVLTCPSFGDGGVVYKVVVGDKTAMGTSMSTWKRKPSEVVLLIEAWHPLPWMSPCIFWDDSFDGAIYPNKLKKYDSKNGHPIIGGYHDREHHVLFADGTVKTYKNWKLPIKELQAMCRTE